VVRICPAYPCVHNLPGTCAGTLHRFRSVSDPVQINDTFGHDAGDEVLLNSAHRMRSQLRPQDSVARLGGDEFAICAQRITSEGLAHLALRLEAVLAKPHQIHGKEVVVAGSVGIHFAVAGESVSEALRLADQAMYVVKASHRHQ
jgi:diguanylate cyclase (GGDEF)-like protein